MTNEDFKALAKRCEDEAVRYAERALVDMEDRAEAAKLFVIAEGLRRHNRKDWF